LAHLGHESGKSLLFSTLKHEKTWAVPWVPFAGVHAGKLRGYSAMQLLSDGDKLFESLMEVNRVYDPDGQPVIFDLQVEAEILGCELMWAKYAPPSVASHPLDENMAIPTRLPEKTDGRLPMILDVMRRMQSAVGEKTALYGLIAGPFTLASHLRGTEIFMDMVDHEEYVHALLAYTAEVSKRMSEYYIQAGMDVIAVVDPVVSQISPRHFKKFMHEPFKEIFSFIKQKNVFSSFFVCGDATKNIESMCLTFPDSISVDENIDLEVAKQITDRYNITIGGNIPLTTRMLLGSQQDNMKYVVDLLEKITPLNFVLSPGCDMPYDVPVQNTIGVLQAIRDPLATRKILAHYQAAEISSNIILPDYDHLDKPLIEVFTIDSDTCAACGYMVGAARRAGHFLAGKVEVVEHKLTQIENVARVKKMGIQHLPAILINGKLKFSSIIPTNQELVSEIEKYL
jgi:uroporphyrinogen decarboxylase